MNRSPFVVGAAMRRGIFSALTVGCLWAAPVQNVQAQQQQVRMPTVEDLLNGSVTLPSAQQYPEVESAIYRFFHDRDVPGARAMLQTAKVKYPNIPPYEILMAQFLAAAQQGPMARAELEQGVKTELSKGKGDYVDPEFYLLFGDIAFQERRVTDAELLFEKAEEMVKKFTGNNPKRRTTLQRRAFAGEAAVCEAREDWAGAKEKLMAWLQVDQDSAAAHQRLGRTLFKLNEPAKALAQFQAAAAADKTMFPAEVMMGRLWEEAEDHKQAKSNMEQAIAGLPQKPVDKDAIARFVNTHLAVAQWAVASVSKDPDSLKYAKTLADKALIIDDSNLDAQLVCGLIDRLNNDWTKAEIHFEKAHDLSPSNFVAINNLALVDAEIGVKDKAKDSKNTTKLERAVELAGINARQYQQNPEAIATLGWVLYRAGKKAEGKQAILTVANQVQVTGDAAFYVAQVLFDEGENALAKMILDNAVKSTQPFAMRSAAMELKKDVDRKDSSKGSEKSSSSDKGK